MAHDHPRTHTSARYRMLAAFLAVAASLLFLALGTRCFYRQSYPRQFEGAVLQYARQYGVDPDLVFAVIRTESCFRDDIVSHAGAVGLMQITPDTFAWLQSKHPGALPEGQETLEEEMLLHPETNIQYGALFLSMLLAEYDDETTALCAYNAGRKSVQRWLGDPAYSDDGARLRAIPYDETRDYVGQVLESRDYYQFLY